MRASLLSAVLTVSVPAVLALPAVASADGPSSADMESARDLIKDGRALRASGDLKGALEKFKAAHALARTAVTGIELARAYTAVGKLVEAREVAAQVVAIPVAPDETSRSTEARAEANKLVSELTPRLGSVRVQITYVPEAPVSGSSTTITIDQQPIPKAALNEARKVNPGAHDVVARVTAGPEARASFTLKEGESTVIKLTVQVPKDVPPPPDDKGGVPVKAGMSPLVPVGLGLLGVGAIMGTVGGVIALNKSSQLKDNCINNICPTNGFDREDVVSSGRTAGTVSTIGFVGAGLGLVVTLVGFALGGSSKEQAVVKTTSGFWFTGTSGGVRGQF